MVEIPDVLQFGPVQILQRADDLPVVGLSVRVEVLVDDVAGMPVRAVVNTLALLVLDDLFLLGDYRLGHRIDEEAHLVGLSPENLLEGIPGNRLEVIRAVSRCGSVQRAADLVDKDVETTLSDILGFEKEQVLEQMCEAGSAFDLPGRTHVIGHGDRHNRIRAVDMENNVKAVVQSILLEVDSQFGAGLVRTTGGCGCQKDESHAETSVEDHGAIHYEVPKNIQWKTVSWVGLRRCDRRPGLSKDGDNQHQSVDRARQLNRLMSRMRSNQFYSITKTLSGANRDPLKLESIDWTLQ